MMRASMVMFAVCAALWCGVANAQTKDALARNAARVELLTRIAGSVCVTGDWHERSPFREREGPGQVQVGKDPRNFVPGACRAVLFDRQGKSEYVFTLLPKERLLLVDYPGGPRCGGVGSVLVYLARGSILGALCKADPARMLRSGEFDYKIRTREERDYWEDELDRLMRTFEILFPRAPSRS